MGKMKEALPFIGMVAVQFIQVALIIIIKVATSTGMTKYVFVFYSNALAAIVLLPTSLIVHRSNRPSISLPLLCKLFMLALLGCTAQVTGNAAIQLTPASFVSAMLNLVPGFTFVLAVVFRMEKLDCRSSTTLAKSIGTAVSIAGAVIVTLYKGPTILATPSHSSAPHELLVQQSDMITGGVLLVIDCIAASGFTIAQAVLLKECGAELIIVFFYCFFVAIMTAVISLVTERDPSAWSLRPSVRLFSILYSGIIGSATQVSLSTWCVQKMGPVVVASFHPLGIVIAAGFGIIFLGDILYLGSLVGSVIIVVGFYAVIWGKAKEEKVVKEKAVSNLESSSENKPLLQSIKQTQV